MKNPNIRKLTAVLSAIMIILSYFDLSAQVVGDSPEELKKIDVEEHLGDNIPLDLMFISDRGDTITLKDYFFKEKPVILILGYYSCPMLCNLIMNGVSEGVRQLSYLPGRDFQIVMISIDPTETDLLASAKKANYIKQIGKPNIENGWDFLTTSTDNAAILSEAVGFKYFYDEEEEQYAHPAVLVFLSPEGKISRYIYGIEYSERSLRMAIMEASEGKVGNTLDRIILYCYHYDPDAGSYVLFAGNVMRIGGFITLILLAGVLIPMWLKERRKKSVVPEYTDHKNDNSGERDG
ncbi:MAG: SCO family protein [candidate division Zixibacteria bacterium]|nr:SCO family protein [candidate division Zixibacteria bacterium]